MAFIPQVLTRYDPYNSIATFNTAYTGIATPTTGYNSIIVTVAGSTSGGTLTINYGSTNSTLSTIYTDTVFSNINFTKNYPIINAYYNIGFISTAGSTGTISTLLSTQTINQSIDSISTFNNNIETIIDAFGKLRVSNPYTLLDIRVPGQGNGSTGFLQNYSQVCNGYTGNGNGATGYKICSNSQMDIYISGNGTFINQSREYCTYQPGKSLLFLGSAILDAGQALGSGNDNQYCISRVGYFDDNNGLYFEYNSSNSLANSTIGICIKNKGSTSGYPILSNNWNIDKMDGTGPSGLRLNFTKAQLFVIDMEWLGVGRIRFGFFAFGKIHYCHQVTNINILTNGPYTTNINLPIRYELQGTNIGSTGAMIQICSTVISEGGYNPLGRSFTANTGITGLSNITNGTPETPIILLRGGNTNGNYYHQSIRPLSITICSSGANDILLYRIRLYYPTDNPANSTWNDVNTTYSVAQYATGVTGFTVGNSIIVDSGYFIGKASNNFNLSDNFNNIIDINADINNNSDIIALTIQAVNVSGNSSIYGSISWNEIY